LVNCLRYPEGLYTWTESTCTPFKYRKSPTSKCLTYSKRRCLKMNDRQMRILESLSSLEILTRTQIQRLHDTKSIRNTNYVMQSLNRYIDHIRLQENAYFLNKRGRTLLGVTRQFKYNSHIHHKLMRNDAYVYFRPQKWKNEQEVSIGSVTITPDAYFKTDRFSFLEVDNTQKWHVNEKKIENYQKFYDTGA